MNDDTGPNGEPVYRAKTGPLSFEVSRLVAVVEDLIELADFAMLQANKGGSEFDRKDQLEAARKIVAIYRKP